MVTCHSVRRRRRGRKRMGFFSPSFNAHFLVFHICLASMTEPGRTRWTLQRVRCCTWTLCCALSIGSPARASSTRPAAAIPAYRPSPHPKCLLRGSRRASQAPPRCPTVAHTVPASPSISAALQPPSITTVRAWLPRPRRRMKDVASRGIPLRSRRVVVGERARL